MAANPNFPSSTFAGTHFAELFGPEVLDPSGLGDMGLATVVDKMKFKSTINEVDDTVVFQTPSATFSSQSTQASTTEVNLEVVPFEFHKEIELSTIYSSWLSENLAPGSMNDYSYDELVNIYLQKVYQPKWKQGASHLILNGKTGLAADIGVISFSAAYTGLFPLLNADNSVTKNGLSGQTQLTIASVTKAALAVVTLSSGSAATSRLFVGSTVSIRLSAGGGFTAMNGDFEIMSITSDTVITINLDTSGFAGAYTGDTAKVRYINRSNIINILSNHITRTKTVVRRAGASIILSQELADEWQFAIAASKMGGGFAPVSAETLSYVGDRMVILDNMPANTIGTWLRKHVFYGYDLSNDETYLKMLWQGERGDETYRLRGRNKTGVAITQAFQPEMMLTTPEA